MLVDMHLVDGLRIAASQHASLVVLHRCQAVAGDGPKPLFDGHGGIQYRWPGLDRVHDHRDSQRIAARCLAQIADAQRQLLLQLQSQLEQHPGVTDLERQFDLADRRVRVAMSQLALVEDQFNHGALR